jgi:peptide deformylase
VKPSFLIHLERQDAANFVILQLMILPIVAYGHSVLRQVAKDIDPEHPQLDKLIADMWETMYASNGVGLAAPQINRPIRLFVVDSSQIFTNLEDEEQGLYPDEPGLKQVFINARIKSLDGEPWSYTEGCLSIPRVREDVLREEKVTLEYFDESFVKHKKTFNGITARVILHEYDHIEGKLFIDHISLLKRKLLKKRLDEITKGKIRTDYKMLYPRP